MATRDDNPKPPNDSGWSDKKHRDDTPSFIRNVQARAELLNPNRSSSESIPVLAMPASIRIWRKVRWPLFIAIILALLSLIGVFTKNRLVDRSVRKEIDDAAEAEAAATIDGLLGADRTLTALADRHPGRANAQVAHAWHSILLGDLPRPHQRGHDRARLRGPRRCGAPAARRRGGAQARGERPRGAPERRAYIARQGVGAAGARPRG